MAVAVQVRQRRRSRDAQAALRAAWGQPKSRDRDLPLIANYHHARVRPAGASVALDARTWADLDLDAVFSFLDRTESVPGRQVLYHRLRSTVHSPGSLADFDELVERLGREAAFRLRAQRVLAPLDGALFHWLWALALEPVEPLPRWAIVYPLFAGLMVLCLCLSPLLPPLLLVPVFGFVGGGALRATLGLRLVPIANSFRDMVRLLVAAGRLADFEEVPEGVRRELTARLVAVAGLRRWGGLLGRGAEANLDLVGVFLEYLNLLFCLDANAVMLGVRELRRHQDDLHAVFEAVGALDAALAIASVRASGIAWTRPVFDAPRSPVVLEALRHPLIDRPVPNSLTLGPPDGLLVTGANMTGKSTFLRTVGVNAVLAQSLHTVFAGSYRAPWLEVASCITAGDSLLAGKSSYQAEVETLVGMLSRLTDGRGGDRLFLFDELFRGTNTLDRIGAASAVLWWLVGHEGPKVGGSEGPKVGGSRCLVIAATHDLELVALLAGRFEAGHFADRLGESGLQFDYVLRPGPTTTRNAIALLGVLGAPPEVVNDALARTEVLRARRG